MKLIDLKITEYMDLVKSNSPAPGGGSASALAGAQAMALAIMVCELTIGRPKYAEYEDQCLEKIDESLKILEELKELIDKDTEAYNKVASAFKMAKETEEEKEKRSKAIKEATMLATETPLRTMELSLMGMRIVSFLIGKTNNNAASDLGVAGINLYAAAKGAWLNVNINLPGTKDINVAENFKNLVTEMEKEGEILLKGMENK